MGTLKGIRKKLLKRHGFRKAVFEGQWDIADSVSFTLEYARIKNGFSQEELAKRMGTKQSAISRAENGHMSSLTFLNNVARAMGMVLVVKFVKAKTMADLKMEAATPTKEELLELNKTNGL